MRNGTVKSEPKAGLAGRLLGWMRGDPKPRRSLVLVDRIPLAPRQSLALVEAEGHHILIATAADGAPAFYPLEERTRQRTRAAVRARVSW